MMDLEYKKSDIAEKKINEMKKMYKKHVVIYILISVIYLIIICLECKRIGAIIIFSVLYIVACSYIAISIRKFPNRLIVETITKEVCLEGFIDINIYNVKKAEKKLDNPRYSKIYNNSLLNLIYGYLRIGDYEQADEIIKVLDNRQLNNDAKALLIRYKAEMAYEKNNKEEFDIQYRKLEDMSNIISLKVKNTIFTSLDLKKNIFENNEEEVGKICEQLINSDVLLNKVMGFYYKGLVLEKNNKEGYEDYYKFVVENGNDLYIAKIASEKI